MTTTRSGRPRKGEESARRDRLLEQAIQLFAAHGYGNLTLETIAREAHVSLRTIYQQFGGKAALFGAVIRHLSDEFVASLPLDGDPSQSLDQTLVGFGRHYLRRITQPECMCLRAQIQAEARRFPELAAEFYRNGPERTLLRLAEFFATQQRKGRLIEADCQVLAGQFINLLRGELFHRLQLGLDDPPSEQETETWAKQAVQLFLHGSLKSDGRTADVLSSPP